MIIKNVINDVIGSEIMEQILSDNGNILIDCPNNKIGQCSSFLIEYKFLHISSKGLILSHLQIFLIVP